MDWSRKNIYLKKGDDRFAAIHTGADVQEMLSEAGYDPSGVNVLVRSLGAGYHDRARILVTQDAISRLLPDGDARPTDQLDLIIGDETDYLTFEGLHPLTVEPVMVSGLGFTTADSGGQRVSILTLVDDRYFWSQRQTTNDYNVLAEDRTRYITRTINGGTNPYTYDQIIALLAAVGGVSITIVDAYAGTVTPIDVLAEGRPWANVLDSLLAETGRVLRRSASGVLEVRNWNTLNVSDWLQALDAKILHGSARAALGTTTPTGWLAQAIPNAKWAAHSIPEFINVTFPYYTGTSRTRRRTTAVGSSIGANTYSLPFRSGYRLVIDDDYPAAGNSGGTILNSTAIGNRAALLAQSYYRRWLAGECDVTLMGHPMIALCGAAQQVIYRVDGVRGVTTQVTSSPNHPLLLRSDPNCEADGAAGFIYNNKNASGDGRSVVDRELVVAKISAVSAGDGFPSNVSYTVQSLDGTSLGPFASGLQPTFRTVQGSAAKVSPASVGSKCIIAMLDYATSPQLGRQIELLACSESLLTQNCATAQTNRSDPLLDFDLVLTDRQGRILTDREGRVLIERTIGLNSSIIANAVITDRYGEPLMDRAGLPLLDTTLGVSAVSDWDKLLTDRDGEALADRDGNLMMTRSYGFDVED